MLSNRPKLIAALLVCCAAPATACTETEAFGFHFGQPVPAGAKSTGGGSVYAQYSVQVPNHFPDFTSYEVSSLTNKRAVYAVTATRRIAERSLMSTPDDHPERKRVEDAAKLEVSALLKLYSEKYGFVYEKAGYPSSFQWEAKTPTLQSSIGVDGIQTIYIECKHRGIYTREDDIARKERGGSFW